MKLKKNTYYVIHKKLANILTAIGCADMDFYVSTIQYLIHKYIYRTLILCSDRDGYLCKLEITEFVHEELRSQGEMSRVSKAEEEDMIRDILKNEDFDNDGRISRLEFSGNAHNEF